MARRRDDDDEDDRPHTRRRREEDDEDDEPRPRRRPRPADEDDEEDRPRSRARARDDEDDEDDRPRRRRKKGGMSKGLLFGLIGGGVALVAIVVLLIVFLGGTVSGPPKAVFEAYWKELKAGNSSRAFDYLSDKSRERFDSQARAFGLGARGHEIFGGFATIEAQLGGTPTVVREQINEAANVASVEVKVQGAFGGGSHTQTYRLVKERGKWKIDLNGGF